MVRKIERLLYDNGICANVWENKTLNTIMVDIEWGNWKHDHNRAKYLVQNEGLKYVTSVITDGDDSDCYSAIHLFSVR